MGHDSDPTPTKGTGRRRRGCVWEIVVLLLIALVLYGVTARVFHRARAPADSRSCLSNVKQLVLGFRMYADDHDGRLPPQPRWAVELYPYVRNSYMFCCPQDPRCRVGSTPEKAEASYALNEMARVKLDRSRVNLPLLFDASGLLGNQSVAAYRHPQKRWGFTQEGLNVGFCDGHVKGVARREFEGMSMQP